MFQFVSCFVYNQVGRLPPTFLDAAKLAIAILQSGYNFSSGKIVYNKFKSVVSYSQADLPLFSQASIQVWTNEQNHIVEIEIVQKKFMRYLYCFTFLKFFMVYVTSFPFMCNNIFMKLEKNKNHKLMWFFKSTSIDLPS